jgi:hypothetical protein
MICHTEKYTIGRIMTQWSTFDLNPVYQRQGGVWSPEKSATFIDTLFMKFDVPKFYLHCLGSNEVYQYAVVDGKQRLSAVRAFFESKIKIPDFTVLPPRSDYPRDQKILPGMTYGDLSESWKEWFKGVTLDIVEIKMESEDDSVEDLFERLNNGSPLNAAELRNAKTGKMSELVRKLASTDEFFASGVYLNFKNTRYSYNDLAAKLTFLTKNDFDLDQSISKKSLDTLVEENANLSDKELEVITEGVGKGLRRMQKVFGKHNELLSKALTHIYFAVIDRVYGLYADPELDVLLKNSFERFEVKRAEESQKNEEQVDRNVARFNQHVQQNTGNASNMKPLVAILMEAFLESNPQVALKDSKRAFTYEERRAVWLRAGKVCQSPGCGKSLTLDEMHADHMTAHVNGGKTLLSNAQCLCVSHNLRKSDA